MNKMLILIMSALFVVSGCSSSVDENRVPENEDNMKINSFEECVSAGNPVMESYPRKCTANGIVFTEDIEEPDDIGGYKDEHGCLVSAGYRWDSDVKACTRSWEVSTAEQKRAVNIAVENISGIVTITEVSAQECEGCYEVKLSKDGKQISVSIKNWKISSGDDKEQFYPSLCYAEGGTPRKESLGCMAEENSIGSVKGFKEPYVCCVEDEKNDYSNAGEKVYCTPDSKDAEICATVYEPVCGFDSEGNSKSYSNSCFACMTPEVVYWKKEGC